MTHVRITARKLVQRLVQGLVVGMMPALTAAAHAAGSHAGGHDHDHHQTEAAIGKPGVAARVQRTITIEMHDSMRYTPANLRVGPGETVRLVVKNRGRVKHELSLGTPQALRAHQELMRKFPDMEHDEPSQITLAPGERGEIIWQFSEAGVVHFACLMPGHYEAGMRGMVQVGRKK